MKPALTDAEWAEKEFTDIHWNVVNVGFGEISLRDTDYYTGAQISTPRLHATAALCLHGQEFGFTREMVAAIRECADVMYGEYGYSDVQAETDLAREAADRIAALLPPEVDPK